MFLLSTSIFSISTVAHDQKELTIVLADGGPVPDSISEGVLVQTDYLFFVNVDKRANSTHRIQVDADNDGTFDGPDDMSTNWLRSSCNGDENDSSIEEDCWVNEFFLLAPENGLLPGNISMRHQIKLDSETTNIPFYVNFGPDIHSQAQVPAPSINTPNESQSINTPNEKSRNNSILAFILVISLLGALITSQKLSQMDEEE